MSFFNKLKNGLAKTRRSITEKVDQVLAAFGIVDEELFEELLDILVSADVGIKTSTYIIENLKESAKANKITKAELVKDLLKEYLLKIMDKGINKIDL